MNYLIVNLVFGILAIILLTGLGIMISDALKIKTFNTGVQRKLKEELAAPHDLKPTSQNKLTPIIRTPFLKLPASEHKMKKIN